MCNKLVACIGDLSAYAVCAWLRFLLCNPSLAALPSGKREMLRVPRVLKISYVGLFRDATRPCPYKNLPTLGGNMSSTRLVLVNRKHDERRRLA